MFYALPIAIFSVIGRDYNYFKGFWFGWCYLALSWFFWLTFCISIYFLVYMLVHGLAMQEYNIYLKNKRRQILIKKEQLRHSE